MNYYAYNYLPVAMSFCNLYNVALYKVRSKLEARYPEHPFDLSCFDNAYNICIANKYGDIDLANDACMAQIHMSLIICYSYNKWLPFFNTI